MKQETLEEAAERLLNFNELDSFRDFHYKQELYNTFIIGIKYQQEQIGKSEFLQKLRGTLSDAEARRLIFETFKKEQL